MMTLWNGFDRTFDRELRRMNKLFGDLEARPHFEGLSLPRVDLVETDAAYELTAEVPGFTADDIDVTVHDGVLTVAGKVEAEASNEGEEGRKVLYRERRQASFARTFRLGDRVDASAIEATVRDGLLTVLLPKVEEEKPRQIAVKAV